MKILVEIVSSINNINMDASYIILAVACFVVTGAQNVTHPEHSEYDGFSFAFDGATGLMTVRNIRDCYIWQLTADEKQTIHTDDGIHQTEMRILSEIDNAYYTVVPKIILHPNIIRNCGYSYTYHYYLVH